MWNKVLVYPTNQLPIIVERSMMKEADSSGILQKLNKTCICTTSEINNDYATKDHSYTQNIVTIAQEITSMKKKKKKPSNWGQNDTKKKTSAIILGNGLVKHIWLEDIENIAAVQTLVWCKNAMHERLFEIQMISS